MFKKETEKAGLKEIAGDEEDLQVKYAKWQGKINRIIQKCERKQKKRRQPIKSVRRLMKLKRNIAKTRKKEKDKVKRKLSKLQETLIDQFIIRENAKEQGVKIKRTTEEIKEKGGVNSAAFWDFKRKIDGHKDNKMVAIKNSQGDLCENATEILREFEWFYEDLF